MAVAIGCCQSRHSPNSWRHFIDLLPYTLTAAQDRVIDEILSDMAADVPMNRLLQGDVGAGKTVVAAAAMFAAAHEPARRRR